MRHIAVAVYGMYVPLLLLSCAMPYLSSWKLLMGRAVFFYSTPMIITKAAGGRVLRDDPLLSNYPVGICSFCESY